jgi:8-oxo-dGTP pyrophosphatase MutT (NUDIX family)
MRTILPPNPRLVPEHAQRVFEGKIYQVYQWDQQMFDGTTEVFEMLKRPDTIVVLAIKDNQLVVVLEQQPQFERPLYGLPMGRHDVETETEVEAAQRELREETGMIFNTWRLISVEQPQHKEEHFVYVYLATDFEEQVEQHLDAGEKITVELMDRDRALKVAQGEQSRYLPTELLESISEINDLMNLPQYGLKS